MADREEFKLSRRQALGALGTIGVASAGAGLGTTAYFSDTESFEGNTLTAGELDLKIDWQQTYDGPDGVVPVNAYPDHDSDGWQSTSDGNEYSRESPLTLACGDLRSGAELDVPGVYNSTDRLPRYGGALEGQEHLIELGDVKPGDEGEVTFSIHLCDNPGYVWMTLQNILEAPGDTTEPEGELGGTDAGELAEHLYLEIWYDWDCDNVLDGGESRILGKWDGVHTDHVTLAQARRELASTDGMIPLSEHGINGWNIPAGAVCRNCFEGERQYCIGVRWWVPEDVGNVIQDDELSFDLGFYTEQCRHNDGCDPREFDLSTGVADWTVTSGPQTGDAVEQTAHNRWVDPTDDSCAWVAPPDDGNTDANGDRDPVGTYRYETTFEVDLEGEPASGGPCRLKIDTSTDNQATFYLDEVSEETRVGVTEGPMANPSHTYRSITTFEQEVTTGEHTLIALVENADDADGGDNPVGLLVCGGVACNCGDDGVKA